MPGPPHYHHNIAGVQTVYIHTFSSGSEEGATHPAHDCIERKTDFPRYAAAAGVGCVRSARGELDLGQEKIRLWDLFPT